MKVIFKIKITHNYHLQCFIHKKKDNKTVTQLPKTIQKEHIPYITFND